MSEWPISLEEGLGKVCKFKPEVFKLATLRRKDIVEAAESNGISPDAFINEINRVSSIVDPFVKTAKSQS